MGELLTELKPLGIVVAVVWIVWLTAIGMDDPRAAEVADPVAWDYVEHMAEPEGMAYDAWYDDDWRLADLEVEAE